MEAIDFWIWFANNKESIENLLDSDLSDYTPYENLCGQLKKYDGRLIPEITGDENGNYVLIISCDGMKEGIQSVEKMVNEAPIINNWTIKKFRQKSAFVSFNIDGVQFDEEGILIRYQKLPDLGQFILEMFLNGYAENDERYGMAAMLYLDHAIGEYDVMTKIYDVSLSNLAINTPKQDLITLRQFADILEVY